MLTICAVAKPFLGHIAVIQRNAIASWTKLLPRPEIILFGSEQGTAEIARDLGLLHIPDVPRNRHGTPLLSGILAGAEQHGTGNLIAYVNADIILPRQFTVGGEKVRQKFPRFLAVGRRTNLEVRQPLDFAQGWEEKLAARRETEGQLESHTGIDFFVFPRGTYRDVPPLAIGRVWFDQWCIKYARKNGLPVVDLTRFAPIVHQLHDYNHVPGGRELGTYGGVEAEENLNYYGERPHRYTILSATHVMTEQGGFRKVFWQREKAAVKNLLWEVFVHKTLGVRKKLGLSSRANA